MGVLKKMMIEFLLVLSVGAALGFGLNSRRGSDAIELTNDYFPDVTAMVEAARAKAEVAKPPRMPRRPKNPISRQPSQSSNPPKSRQSTPTTPIRT